MGAAGRAQSPLSPSALGLYWACQISEKNPRAENSPQSGPVAGPEPSARAQSGMGGGTGPGQGITSHRAWPSPTPDWHSPCPARCEHQHRGCVVPSPTGPHSLLSTNGQRMWVALCQCGLEKLQWLGRAVWLLVPLLPPSGSTSETSPWPGLPAMPSSPEV